ncbi:MAG TPA: LemA family protein [Acidimicrobiales bacterium]
MQIEGIHVVLFAAVTAVAAWVVDRRRRAYLDQPTTLAAAVFAGRNEVEGRAWVAQPVVSHRTQTPSIWWDYVLEEERTHTRTTTHRNSDGSTRTETQQYQEWHEIDRKSGEVDAFEIVDSSGSVPVSIDGARIDARTVLEDVHENNDRGFFESLFDNRTGRYRETERVVGVGDTLFVVGNAVLDDSTSVPVLREAFVSTRDEEEHTSSLGFFAGGLAVVAAIAFTFGVAMMLSPRDPMRPRATIPGVVGAAVVFVVAWAVRTYNRLRIVAEGVQRARSLVDVQLQRRRDLIPALAAVVKAHAAHERAIVDIASGPPADDVERQTADLRAIFAIAEAHPELTADVAYVRLRDEIADCEGRIEASRTFQNDCRTLLRDRSRQFPDALVARRLALGAADSVVAATVDGFERTAPRLERAFG